MIIRLNKRCQDYCILKSDTITVLYVRYKDNLNCRPVILNLLIIYLKQVCSDANLLNKHVIFPCRFKKIIRGYYVY